MRLILAVASLALVSPVCNSQTGAFQPSFQMTKSPTGCQNGNPQVAIGDFNADHKPDVAILCAAFNGASLQILVLLGDGKGGFSAPIVFGMNSFPLLNGNFLAADMNGDGKSDLIFETLGGPQTQTIFYCDGTGEGGPATTFATMLSQGAGAFSQPIVTQTNAFPNLKQIADLNGDGIPDAVTDRAGFMLGHKDGTFGTLTPIAAPAGECLTSLQQVADFNNDGKPDILAGAQSGDLILFLNKGGGTFSSGTVVANASVQLAADFNGDGILDLLIAPSFNANAILFGNGGGAFQAPVTTSPLFQSVVFALDINGDGKSDMVQAASTSGAPSVGLEFYISNGDGTFQRTALTSLAGFKPYAVADFNGDGLPDIAGFGTSSLNLVAADTLEVLINTTSLAGVTGAVNGASFAKGQALTAGALVSVFGNGFTAANAPAALAQSIPLPMNLGNVSVTVGGVPAPLQYVSSTQINLQVPWEITGSTADIIVTANGTVLPTFHASLAPVVPGVFTTQSGVGQAIAINPDGSLAGPANSIPGLAVRPAKVGDVLEILATGLGAVSPAVADGANTLDGLRQTAVMPAVLIGGVPATVSFSGLAPQFAGVNQINVTVPQVGAGVVPLQIQAGGITTSNQATIAVAQ